MNTKFVSVIGIILFIYLFYDKDSQNIISNGLGVISFLSAVPLLLSG
jgi:hypothetical protein